MHRCIGDGCAAHLGDVLDDGILKLCLLAREEPGEVLALVLAPDGTADGISLVQEGSDGVAIRPCQ
jgi:hypothetical protein